MSFKRMLITIAWAAGIALLVWFERSSQHRQTKQWEKVRSRGKWPFVINRYLLARAGVLLLLLFLPVMIQLGATTPLLVALAFSVLILCPLFLYIGYHEWMKNEREFLADPLIKASRARIEQGKLP